MQSANKVAQLTLTFWIMKMCATTLAETGGDLMSKKLALGYFYSSILLLGVYAVTLLAQLRAKAFHPVLYWSVILATATAGTTISDYMDRTLNLGYPLASALLALALIGVLIVWRIRIGSISVSHVTDPRTEHFYWTAILVSNTLGTALGDYLADDAGLGFALGSLLIAAVIGVIAVLYLTTTLSRIGLFWAAFVLTRPFGATFGDLLTMDRDEGGLGFGTVGSSAVLFAIFAALVFFSLRDWRRRQPLADAGPVPATSQ